MTGKPHPLIAELRTMRIAAGLSVPQVAARIGYGPRQLYRWESGTHSPHLDALTSLAAVLGFQLGWAAAEFAGRKPHGTRAAAARHRYHGEPLCEPCRAADRAYDRRRKRIKRARESWHAAGLGRTA